MALGNLEQALKYIPNDPMGYFCLIIFLIS